MTLVQSWSARRSWSCPKLTRLTDKLISSLLCSSERRINFQPSRAADYRGSSVGKRACSVIAYRAWVYFFLFIAHVLLWPLCQDTVSSRDHSGYIICGLSTTKSNWAKKNNSVMFGLSCLCLTTQYVMVVSEQ